MTVYYVKQDNTIWGCGDPSCCGEYYEDINEEFIDCTCKVEVDADHLHVCNGGGPVLDWRKATPLEVIAYNSGVSNSYWDAFEAGVKFAQDRTIQILGNATGHNGKTHYEGIDCKFCEAVVLIRKDN